MKIWAHRGCSQNYPENTMTAFKKACAIPGLAGIETDIQISKDGHLMVFHDERVERTTDGTGFLRDYTYEELRHLRIDAGDGKNERIPCIEELLDLLQDKVHEDAAFKLNNELKNSVYPYPGMEEKIVDLIHKRRLQKHIVYSTFYAKSLEKLSGIDPEAELGILDVHVSDCMYKIKGGCKAVAVHPFWRGIDVPKEELKGITVRAWMSGHLYPEKPTGTRLDFKPLEEQGITDIILNEPEVYL